MCLTKIYRTSFYLHSNADADANADAEIPMPRFRNGHRVILSDLKETCVIFILSKDMRQNFQHGGNTKYQCFYSLLMTTQ